MRVLLIDPPMAFTGRLGHVRPVFPLGLSCVAAVLVEDGHDVRILLPDLRADVVADPWAEIRMAVQAESPDLVGITGMSPQGAAIRRTVEEVRGAVDAPIVVGGQHATCWSDEVASWPGVTAAVAGEGEIPIQAIARGVPLLRVPGVVTREGRGPAPEIVRDLDDLPFPYRRGLVWGSPGFPSLFTALNTTRGCPFACTYCSLGHHVRYRSPEKVLEEIDILVREHGATNLLFHDAIFPLHRERTLRILAGMEARRVPFVAQTRCDVLDPDIANAMARAGCVRVFLGIESGDEETLARLGKGMTLDTIRTAVGTVKDAGMEPCGFFIVGFPWEDGARIRKTVDFALSLDLSWVSLHSANPIPGSRLWDEAPPRARVVARDFVGPELNLTALPDAAYTRLFQEMKGRCDAWNLERARRRFTSGTWTP